jgi:hypothetical protein
MGGGQQHLLRRAGGRRGPLEEDFAPRAIPLIAGFGSLLDSASLVLHATDPVFDFAFDRLPGRHHYVGPLGIWEPPGEPVTAR